MAAEVQEFFHKSTSTLTYVIYDASTRDAVVIDPVLDYDPATQKVSTEALDILFAFLREERLRVHFILETHAHADHLSSAQSLKKLLMAADGATPKGRVQVAISEHIREVQKIFAPQFYSGHFAVNGSQFDLLLKDGDSIQAGSLTVDVMATPGHTPACTTYLIENLAFVGDLIFMPDSGTGRCDFPGGSAPTLFQSIREFLFGLPDETHVFVGHDYQPGGRSLKFSTTIGAQMLENIHLNRDTPRDKFIEFRETRDKTLAPPKLLGPSLKVNIAGGG